MIEDLSAHFAEATRVKRLQLIERRPDKATPGEAERLREELARFNRPVHVSEPLGRVIDRLAKGAK